MGRSDAVPARIKWAVDLLSVGPKDRILEIGCGPGVALSLICDLLDGGGITAIDRSAIAVERAQARIAHRVAGGRAVVRQQELAGFRGRGRFDKAFAVNVNVFWTSEADLECDVVTRVLRPGGTLWLVYEMPATADERDRTKRITANLGRHGFTTEVIHHPTAPLVCIVGKTHESLGP